jgi:flagellar M-ring protein FliF
VNALTAPLQRVLGIVKSFTPGQKVVTVLAVVGLVVGGLLFTQWAGQPTYAPLFSNLSASDASAIVDKLNSSGVKYQLANSGTTILVPQDKVYDTRIAVSGQGLPSNDSNGYALLDKQGVTTSEFQQQVTYQCALEGELTNTIKAIDGVDAAVVHLAIPQKDVFSKDTDKPTASVLVSTQPGRQLSAQQVQAVVNLVSASVAGMAPEDVTVADSQGRVLSSPDGVSSAAGDARDTQTASYENRVSQSLQDMLDRLVGPGHSVVRLTADLDYDQTETQTETYNSTKGAAPLSSSKTTEKYSGAGGTTASGVLGPDNIAVPSSGATPGANAYEKTSEQLNPAVNKVTEQRKSAPGAVRKLNVAVLLDTKTAGSVNPTDVQGLISSAVGLDVKRGDTIQVTRAPFDDSAAQADAASLAQAKADAARTSQLGLLETGGLVLLVLAVLLYAFLAGRRKRKKDAGGSLSADERATLERLQEQLELQMAERAAELESGTAAAAAIEAGPTLDPHRERVTAARDDIAEMVQNQPEEVAQLLRAWLADRRS